MNQHPDVAGSTATDRREVLKKAAVGGAIVWVAPTILASRAGAQGTCVGLVTDWDTISVPQIGYLGFDGGTPIGATGFIGNNVDIVSPSFFATPPWTSTQNWLDLVGTGTDGFVTAEFQLDCAGTFDLEFQYSSYAGAGQTITVDVNGVATGPLATPAPGSPATFLQSYGPFATGDPVTITISGTGSANQGPAVGNISFTRS